jgi:hypothetical protein
MTVYGSRDRNPFQVPKEYEINGVKTPSNNGDKKYYTLVDSSTGQITVKSPTPAGALFGSDSDNTIGTISKDGTFKPSLGVANVNETKYFSSAVGQKDVKNHGVITAQKAGAQNAQQLIFPNSATAGAGQGQNVASAGPTDTGEAIKETKTSGFGSFVYPLGLGKTKQDVIKFTMLEYRPSGLGPVGQQRGGFGNARNEATDRTIAGTVVLPIPNGISDTNSVDWGGNPMNALEAAMAAAAFTGITEGLGAGVESFGKSLSAAVGEDKTGRGIGAAFAGAATGTNGNAILSRAEGAVVNPNLELLFNGPQLRPFQFTFKLSARSKDESKQIIKILNFFKRGMSPIKTESNLFLKAPNTFKIQYLYRPQGENADHPYIGRIKECALQSVTTSYTPEGQYATFSDGVMVSYQLTMQFQELEPVFNNDYDGIEGIGF